MKNAIIASLLALVMVGSASAAVVTLDLQQTGNNWQLFASVPDDGSSDGIAGIAVYINGATTAAFKATAATVLDESFTPIGAYGFNAVAKVSPMGGNHEVLCGLDPGNVAYITRGLGQKSVTVNYINFGTTPMSKTWAAPLLVAEGTGTPSFGAASANVLKTGMDATEAASVVLIPEPATMALLSIGGIAALIRRRR